MKHYKKRTKGVFSCDNLPLQFYGCIQQENVIISIIPSINYNLINDNLPKRLKILAKHIQSTQVVGENVHIFKVYKITMDKYVFHLDYYVMVDNNSFE